MTIGHTARICLLITTLALLAAPVANAQMAVDTYIEIMDEAPPEAQDWQGQPLMIPMEARLCWTAAGGVNLDDGSFNISAEADAPAGYNATVDPQEANFTPPPGPTDGSGCTQPMNFTLTLQADDTAEANETLNITVTFSAQDEEPVGTYHPPEDNSTTIQVMTAAFIPEDPDDDEDPADTPGPAIALFLLALAWVLVRKRRQTQQ